jgi:hypothetical protein
VSIDVYFSLRLRAEKQVFQVGSGVQEICQGIRVDELVWSQGVQDELAWSQGVQDELAWSQGVQPRCPCAKILSCATFKSITIRKMHSKS